MGLTGLFFKHNLKFRFPAGTSRGVLNSKDTWFLKIWDTARPKIFGVGECGPLPGLSPDQIENLDAKIEYLLKSLKPSARPHSISEVLALASTKVSNEYPALKFALESALLDLINGGTGKLFSNGFYEGEIYIPINGLVWMDKKDGMIKQVLEKLDQGFSCIKLKIGAINFTEELEVLKFIRENAPKDLVLRVDANGAFSPNEALKKLDQLAEFNIHSIEQPIAPGRWDAMENLCQHSPIPIALDEELIGFGESKHELLNKIKPHYIILKPTLLGGFRETEEWIALADKNGIGWWITSMLESNIGLNAIAQYAAGLAPHTTHGLGTGKLYHNNIESPLIVQSGHISYLSGAVWDLSFFDD